MNLRRFVWAGLWILSLISISFYGGAVSYGFFFALSLLPAICFVSLICIYRRFRIYQSLESRNVVCGQPVPYYFVLQNEDYFAFPGIRIRFFSSFSEVELLSQNPEYELLPGDRYMYETKLTCKYRGEYEVGVKEVVITDFLRFFSLRYKLPGTIKALVLPKITEVSNVVGMQEIYVSMQREAAGSDTEPDSVVRDYVQTDARKQIHWKATAKARKLKVRGRIGEEKQGIAIIYDTKRYSADIKDYLPVENKILETVIAIGLSLCKKNISFSAYGADRDRAGESVSGIQDFDRFYQKIAASTFRTDQDVVRLLRRTSAEDGLALCKLVVLVLQSVDGETELIIDVLTRNGQFVLLYLVTADEHEAVIRTNNERRKMIVIPPEAELEGRL